MYHQGMAASLCNQAEDEDPTGMQVDRVSATAACAHVMLSEPWYGRHWKPLHLHQDCRVSLHIACTNPE